MAFKISKIKSEPIVTFVCPLKVNQYEVKSCNISSIVSGIGLRMHLDFGNGQKSEFNMTGQSLLRYNRFNESGVININLRVLNYSSSLTQQILVLKSKIDCELSNFF